MLGLATKYPNGLICIQLVQVCVQIRPVKIVFLQHVITQEFKVQLVSPYITGYMYVQAHKLVFLAISGQTLTCFHERKSCFRVQSSVMHYIQVVSKLGLGLFSWRSPTIIFKLVIIFEPVTSYKGHKAGLVESVMIYKPTR